jgi:hypothetical protein
LYVGGFSLAILGLLQIRTRPREPGDGFYQRFVNLGTLWSLCCIAVGAGLLAIALGYWDGPLGPRAPEPPAPKQRHRH